MVVPPYNRADNPALDSVNMVKPVKSVHPTAKWEVVRAGLAYVR